MWAAPLRQDNIHRKLAVGIGRTNGFEAVRTAMVVFRRVLHHRGGMAAPLAFLKSCDWFP